MFSLSTLITQQQKKNDDSNGGAAAASASFVNDTFIQQQEKSSIHDGFAIQEKSSSVNTKKRTRQTTVSTKKDQRNNEDDDQMKQKRKKGEWDHGIRSTTTTTTTVKSIDHDSYKKNGDDNDDDNDDDDDDKTQNDGSRDGQLEEDVDDRNTQIRTTGIQLQNQFFHQKYSGIVKALYLSSKSITQEQDQQSNSTFPQQKGNTIATTTTEKDKTTLNVIHDALNAPTTRDLVREEDDRDGHDGHDDYDNDDNNNIHFAIDKYDMVGRYEARRILVRNINPKTGRKSRRQQDVSYRLETPEEIAVRIERMNRSMDRTLFVTRWNRRKINVQMEVDVGNAFAARAQRYLKDTLVKDKNRRLKEERNNVRKTNKQQERRQQQQEEKDRLLRKSDNYDGDDGLEEDGSLVEQNQLLARFTQRHKSEEKKKEQNSGRGLSSQSNVPFRDQFDTYWDFGYSKPNKDDLQYNYNPTVEEMIQNPFSQQAIRDGLQEKNDEPQLDRHKKRSAVSIRKLVVLAESSGTFVYFPPNITRVTNANATYRKGYTLGHIRQLMTMAARSLCGNGPLSVGCDDDGNNKRTDLENRYLRLFCVQSKIHDKSSKTDDGRTLANFGNHHFIHTLAEERGQDMLLYAQSIWNNSLDAAVRLGLVSCQQNIPIAGNMLSRIQSHSKSNRMRVSRLYRKGTELWDPNSSSTIAATNADDDDVEDYRTGSAELDLHLSIGRSDAVASIRGDRDPIHNVTSADALTGTLRRADRGEEMPVSLLTPDVLYAHIPCTTPPVPFFPMDPSSTVFGPVDRYARFYHKSFKLDDQAIKLTLSTLLARLAAQARRCKAGDANKVQMEYTQRQIETFLMESATVNENQLFKMYGQIFPKSIIRPRDVPMVHVYHAVVRYCSYLANTGLALLPSHSDIEEELDEDSSVEAIDENDDERPGKRLKHSKGEIFVGSEPHEIAKRLSSFCWKRIQHDSLLRFPRFRITAAVARICSNLPPSAAEILSRSLDNTFYRTPLDLFKQTLHHMEENEMISDSSVYGDRESINAGELEYILYESSGVFLEAVRIDPLNVEYLLWLVGCLASCLLVSSGNKIGSGAHFYPSQKRRGLMTTSGLSHEVRVRLKKYSAVRTELGGSVRSLFTLVEHQRSARAHFALVSLLEWGQVMALLMDRSSLDHFHDIRKLHTFHVSQWLKHETSSFSFKYAERCKDQQGCCLRARQLENDPGTIRHWRRMVMCLGKLGSHSTTSIHQMDKEHRITCPECSRLSSQRWFDHDLILSEKSQENWWGKGREWWCSSLLNMVPLGIKTYETTKIKQEIKRTISRICGTVPLEPVQQHHRQVAPQVSVPINSNPLLNNQRRERKAPPKDIAPQRIKHQPPPVSATMMMSPERVVPDAAVVSSLYCSTKRLEWLPTTHRSQCQDESLSNLSDQIRSESYEKYMPRTYQDVMTDKGTLHTEGTNCDDDDDNNNGSNSNTDTASSPSDGVDTIPLIVSSQSLEVLAYRIYIYCHLQSIAHPLVEEYIYALVTKCGNRTSTTTASDNHERSMENDCDEFRILQWLMCLGMDIEAILIKKSRKTRK
jgi:hypothetical protein